MRNQDFKDLPEYRAATAFPLAVILLSIFGVVAYLVTGTAIIQDWHPEAHSYLSPQSIAMPDKR